VATFGIANFLNEARRRRVFRSAAIYVVGAWISLQVADLAFPGLGIPESAIRYVWITTILGLPIALVFSWRYDVRGGRLVRTVSDGTTDDASIGRMDFVVLGVLSIVAMALTFNLISDISRMRTQVAGPKVLAEANTLAVLPFVNMSEDTANEYFADGISEEILNLLARLPDLKVTSRSSAFSFKGQNVDIPTIAARLNVAHVLEGSVRRSGDQVRITAQLIEAESDTHLWSETFERELDNIFIIQDEIAVAVAQALELLLLGDMPRVTSTDSRAYDLYLQGRYFHHQMTLEGLKRAETLLRQAVEIDPAFAPAVVELGEVYSNQANGGLRPIDEGHELARSTVQRAIEIDPQYGRAHTMQAMIAMFYDWDFEVASQHLQRARDLGSNDAEVFAYMAFMESLYGRLNRAIELSQQSVLLDPLSPTGHRALGRHLYKAGRLDDAAASLQMAQTLRPDLWALQQHIGQVLLAQGDALAALAAVEQEVNPIFRLTGMAIVQYALGDIEAANIALQELIEEYADDASAQISSVYAFRGEPDHAFDWLEEAYRKRDSGVVGIAQEPVFASLHDDPRWEPLLRKIGLPF